MGRRRSKGAAPEARAFLERAVRRAFFLPGWSNYAYDQRVVNGWRNMMYPGLNPPLPIFVEVVLGKLIVVLDLE